MSSLSLVAVYDSDSDSDVLSALRPAKNARLLPGNGVAMVMDDDPSAPAWSLSSPPTTSLSPSSPPQQTQCGVTLVLPGDASTVYGPLWTASPTPCPSPSSSSASNDWPSAVSGRAAALRCGTAIPSLAPACNHPTWAVAAATICFDTNQHATLVQQPWLRAKRTRPPPSSSAPSSASAHATATPAPTVSPLLSADLAATAASVRATSLTSMATSGGNIELAVDPARLCPPPPPPPSPMHAAARGGEPQPALLPPPAAPVGKVAFPFFSSTAAAAAAGAGAGGAGADAMEPALRLQREDCVSVLGPLVRAQQGQLLAAFQAGMAM